MSKAARNIGTPAPSLQSKTCPALAMARLIDADERMRELFEKVKFERGDDKNARRILEHADEKLAHMKEVRLRALVLTRAESLQGAIAKMGIAFTILYCEADDPHDNAFQAEHFKFLGRELMADARRYLETVVGPFAEIGLMHWYSDYLEMAPQIQEAEAIIEARRMEKEGRANAGA